MTNDTYGDNDSSYIAAGREDGIRRLVDSFYAIMETLPEARDIRAMHADDLTVAREKLTCFLCGWLGGPREYAGRYGPISIPQVHHHLNIGTAERDAWMRCMRHAIAKQPYAPSFQRYLLEQFALPAERIRQVCEHR